MAPRIANLARVARAPARPPARARSRSTGDPAARRAARRAGRLPRRPAAARADPDLGDDRPCRCGCDTGAGELSFFSTIADVRHRRRHHRGRARDRVVLPRRRGDRGGGASLPRVGPLLRSAPVSGLLGAAVVVAGLLAPVLDVPSGGEPSVTPAHVFPIDGPHDLGRSATNSFGGGRGHQGQDMFADCGTPLVSASDGVVRRAVSGDPVAGNHLVIEDAVTQDDYVYMHLQHAPRPDVGDRVAVGSSASARSVGRATPRAATCTSRCGRRRAGSAAWSATPSRCCAAGTARASRSAAPGGSPAAAAPGRARPS